MCGVLEAEPVSSEFIWERHDRHGKIREQTRWVDVDGFLTLLIVYLNLTAKTRFTTGDLFPLPLNSSCEGGGHGDAKPGLDLTSRLRSHH